MILHIVLLILKILGFLVLGILALIFLLALALLLSPAVYQVHISGKDTLDSLNGTARFRWLFRLISGEARYENGELTWRFRAAWKRFGSEDAGSAGGDEATGEAETVSKAAETGKAETVSKSAETGKAEAVSKSAETGKAETTGTSAENGKTGNTGSTASIGATEDKGRDRKKNKDGDKKSPSVYERIWKFPGKIKYTFQKICDKIRALKQKKEALADFIRDEIHQNAFRRVIREVRRLIQFLKPDHAEIEIEFGFSDPAYTGYTLAVVSIFWPAIGEYTKIQPDFERRILRGKADVKGKIRAVYALILAWNLVWDRNVRTAFKHVRKFIK